MTKSDGKSKIDAVEAGELTIQVFGTHVPQLQVKYAYSNAASGDRFGSGLRNAGWSDLTMERLTLLLEAVERDIAGAVFEEGSTTTGSIADELVDSADGVPSL